MTTGTATLTVPLRLRTPPGVYEPQDDTRLLADALRREGIRPGADVLDVGTGNGALALEAARLGARVTAVDISWWAVLTARFNAWCSRQRVSVHHGDLMAAVRDRAFDLVISNPPYVPSPDRWPPRGAARAWDAGEDGRALLDRVCAEAPEVLRPSGSLLLVHSGLCGVEDTLTRLREAGLSAVVTDRTSIPFGPVLLSRLAWLRQTGLPAVDPKEELVVIRATKE